MLKFMVVYPDNTYQALRLNEKVAADGFFLIQGGLASIQVVQESQSEQVQLDNHEQIVENVAAFLKKTYGHVLPKMSDEDWFDDAAEAVSGKHAEADEPDSNV